MTPEERELLRLQVMLALWPAGAGRDEFKTEVHLKRALEEAYNEVFPRKPTAHELRDIAEKLLSKTKGD